MPEPIVIIHGWSDNSSSFKNLATFLGQQLGNEVININLADWISMNDDVSYADVAEAMNRAWVNKGLPTNQRIVNVVVHSTGALIVREWMTRYFNAGTVPIKRLLMLAPANFGSPLAHKGRSFIGRAVKGWGNDGFETGEKILKGLELASPYSWNLALKDLFTNDAWYGENKILATVLIGNKGYDGLQSIANENGSDGTVRISTANLNATKIRLELDEEQSPINFNVSSSNGQVAFGIVDKFNHTTITLSETKEPKPEGVLESLILGSLKVIDDDYIVSKSTFPWQSKITDLVGDTSETSPRLQNAVIKASDNLGNKVDDYFVEFYRQAAQDTAFEQELYTRFISNVHIYCDDGSYRSLYLNITELDNINEMKSMSVDQLFVSITAQPIYQAKNSKRQPVGYIPINARSAGGLLLQPDQIKQIFQPHQTVLIEVVLTRKLSEDVFKLTEFR
jgi:pimeloyl-ACP methyl ester carboxylesterase